MAVSDLCQQHWVALLRLAVLMVDDRQAAEDVVQEAFAEVTSWPEPVFNCCWSPGRRGTSAGRRSQIYRCDVRTGECALVLKTTGATLHEW